MLLSLLPVTLHCSSYRWNHPTITLSILSAELIQCQRCETGKPCPTGETRPPAGLSGSFRVLVQPYSQGQTSCSDQGKVLTDYDSEHKFIVKFGNSEIELRARVCLYSESSIPGYQRDFVDTRG